MCMGALTDQQLCPLLVYRARGDLLHASRKCEPACMFVLVSSDPLTSRSIQVQVNDPHISASHLVIEVVDEWGFSQRDKDWQRQQGHGGQRRSRFLRSCPNSPTRRKLLCRGQGSRECWQCCAMHMPGFMRATRATRARSCLLQCAYPSIHAMMLNYVLC